MRFTAVSSPRLQQTNSTSDRAMIAHKSDVRAQLRLSNDAALARCGDITQQESNLCDLLVSVIQNVCAKIPQPVVGMYIPILRTQGLRSREPVWMDHPQLRDKFARVWILALPGMQDETTMRYVQAGLQQVQSTEAIPNIEGDTIEPDVIVVPAIGFDRRGYRMGYGGGYFDRYMAQHKVVSIGVAFDWQIKQTFPVDPWDIPMDWLCTPSGLVHTRQEHSGEIQ